MLSPNEKLWYARHNKSAILTHAAIWRKGVTATDTSWDHATNTVAASVFARPKKPEDRGDALSLQFSIASKGGGETEIDVLIRPGDFPAIIALMSATDAQATLKAMADELRHQICGPDL